jgi:hypothetical protein
MAKGLLAKGLLARGLLANTLYTVFEGRSRGVRLVASCYIRKDRHATGTWSRGQAIADGAAVMNALSNVLNAPHFVNPKEPSIGQFKRGSRPLHAEGHPPRGSLEPLLGVAEHAPSPATQEILLLKRRPELRSVAT